MDQAGNIHKAAVAREKSEMTEETSNREEKVAAADQQAADPVEVSFGEHSADDDEESLFDLEEAVYTEEQRMAEETARAQRRAARKAKGQPLTTEDELPQAGDHSRPSRSARAATKEMTPPPAEPAPATSPPAEARPPEMEQQLPEQYEVLGKLRQGGMGAIFKAKNKYTGTTYAVKVLLPKCAADEEMRKRFIGEAQAASALKHPGICQVRDFGISPCNMPYLVMDWIDGVSLQDVVYEKGHLSIEEAIPLFMQMFQALAFAHQRRVIHRDLKPDHMLLTKVEGTNEFELRIVDFGIAKIIEEDKGNTQEALTRTGTVIGTPTYMSPEQARGMPIDQTSDIYSIACVMYYTLAGVPPFTGDTYLDTMYKHINDPPPEFDSRLKIPADLRAIIFRSLEKEPKDRYQTMEELAADVRKVTEGDRVERRTLSHERKKSRQRIQTAIYFVVGFVFMYVLSMLFQNWMDSDTTLDPAPSPAVKPVKTPADGPKGKAGAGL